MIRVLFAAALLAATAPLAACARAETSAQEDAMIRDEAAPASTPEAAKAWLAENAKQPGVVVLPSGIQYRVTKSGPADGPRPKPADTIKVHYEGSLTNGAVFDSSLTEGTPLVARLDNLVPGWIEALQLMRPGDAWTIWLPPEQGYGAEGAGPIPPHSVLAFKIELLGVLPNSNAG
jgi:FKBP-type peptidyl-prolyl cis-trans isomerase